jgi:hypothetical protein
VVFIATKAGSCRTWWPHRGVANSFRDPLNDEWHHQFTIFLNYRAQGAIDLKPVCMDASGYGKAFA